MAGYSTSNSHRCKTFQLFLLCMLQVFLLWGCGGDSSEQGTADRLMTASADTGSASFAIQWHGVSAKRASALVRQAIDDCGEAGVESITCEVYDESHNPIASGGPWNCSDHQGTIEGIPAGSSRMVAVLGWSGAEGGGEAVYQGQAAGITINPGEIADAGTIDAYPFIPSAPEPTAVYGNRIDLSWNNLGFDKYRVYRDGVMIFEPDTPSYSDSDLSQETKYCYTISAVDGFGNESGQSDPTCATTTSLSIWYRDSDGDTYGNPDDSIQAADQPAGFVADNNDCNDEMPAIHPGADEICNGIDDDCDDSTDEGVLNTYYADIDDDGYGDPGNPIYECEQPQDYVTDATDCDDEEPSVNPGEREMCYDGIDNNCDDAIDDPCEVIVVYPTSSFTARLIGNQNVLVGDANDQEGKPFNSTFLSIKEGTSDRVCLEFDMTSQPLPVAVTLDFQMSNLDDPAYSMISLYSYNANGLANAEDYFQVAPSEHFDTFSDYGAIGTNSYSIDVTDAYLTSIKRERTFMGILLKADDTNARYDVYNPVLTLSY